MEPDRNFLLTEPAVAAVPPLLEVGDSLQMTVSGDCMAPLFGDGQQVTVVKSGHYLPGDVIVFADELRGVLVHRLLGWVPGRAGARAMSQADSATVIDVLVPAGRVFGRVESCDGAELVVTVRQRLAALRRYARWCVALCWRRLLRR